MDARKIENKFPPVEKTNDFIKNLKAINLVDTSLAELDKVINNYFELIPFASGFIKKGETVFRARINENDTSFENISELGLKPKEKVKEYGRANRPEESIFYCSDNFGMACGEVLQNFKKYYNPRKKMGVVTVGEWEILRDLHISPVYYSESVMAKRKDVEYFKKHNSEYLRAKGIIKEETLDASDLLLEFFCDEFSKKSIDSPNDYKYSVWYMWKLNRMNDLIHPQFNNQKFDGIVYPSVVMNYQGDNIALIAIELDTKIKFKTAYEVICTDFDFENAKFRFAKIGQLNSVDENGKLNRTEL